MNAETLIVETARWDKLIQAAHNVWLNGRAVTIEGQRGIFVDADSITALANALAVQWLERRDRDSKRPRQLELEKAG